MVKKTVDAILKGAIGYINRALDEVRFVRSPYKAEFFSTAKTAIMYIERLREQLDKL